MFTNMTEVKKANKEKGGHFFDKNTLRFFNSRIESSLLKNKYFITSEWYGEGFKRLYTIREALKDGSIKTIGKFQEHKTKELAKEAIKKI